MSPKGNNSSGSIASGARRMDALATPHQAINKNFLIALGLWPYQTGLFKYAFLFNMLFFTMSQAYFQIGGMLAAWEAKDVFLEAIPPVIVDFVCFAKIINFIAKSDEMKELLVTLEADWRKIKDDAQLEIMNNYAIVAKKFTLFYAGCMYGSMTPFMLIPAVPIFMDLLGSGNETTPRQLMFRVDYLMDAEKYYYPLLIHSYFGTLAYITCCVGIDSMCMAYVQHACGLFGVLGYRLEHLTDGVDIDLDVNPEKINDTTYHTMVDCVIYHNHALKYSKLIENANYISYFFQLGFNMVCITFTAFQSVIYMDTPEIAVRYVAFTITQLTILFLQSYPGQVIYDHSIRVSEYAYNCNWYQTSIRTRTLVDLMTQRGRRPCELTAGRFYILNLANYSAVVRTSISYLTVLTSVK